MYISHIPKHLGDMPILINETLASVKSEYRIYETDAFPKTFIIAMCECITALSARVAELEGKQ